MMNDSMNHVGESGGGVLAIDSETNQTARPNCNGILPVPKLLFIEYLKYNLQRKSTGSAQS